MEDLPVRILLTLVGLAAAAWPGRLLARSSRALPKSAAAGLVAVAVSQVCYLLVVWTSLKTHPSLWRVWWVTLVGTVTAAHVIMLRLPRTGRRGRVEQATVAGAVASALMLASLAFRGDILASPPSWFVWALAVPATVTVVGSVLARVRVWRSRPRRPVSPWIKVGWAAAALAAVFLGGFYSGRLTAPEPDPFDPALSSLTLAGMEPAELDAQVRADLDRLKKLAAGLDELEQKAAAARTELRARRKAEGRAYYTPEEDDQVRALFMSFLAYRTALMRMAAAYAGFEQVRDPVLRARCFLVGYGAGTTLYQASLKLVTAYGDDPLVRRKLNEPDAAWGMPGGKFDEIYRNVTSDRVADTFQEMTAYFAAERPAWAKAGVLAESDFEWLNGRIELMTDSIRKAGRSFDRDAARVEQLSMRVRDDAYQPVYAAQSVLSTWIGDTRLVARPAFISPKQIGELQPQLQPGDILLERRNWFVSNAFLPGFWPHAALYVGTPKDLERLGVIRKDGAGRWTADDPAVRDRLARYLAPAHDGEAHTVLESISDGVVFNSLAESMGADYVAVLRPRLSDADKAKAVVRAFGHEGKPYDFEFDFFSSDKLVCTELVYRSYEGMLHFDLVRVMGRDTLPALEICRKYARERGSPGRELDFVTFLDTAPGAAGARVAGEEEFCASADRPRGFNE